MSDDKDPQRISDAADNCEVLRARLVKYEDAEGRPLQPAADLSRRIDQAITEFTSGRACMHVPPRDTDVDIVLSECLKLANTLESQAREIERLKRSAQTNWNEFAEGMKAQPSGVVLPERLDLPHRDEFESADQYAAAVGESKKWNACLDEVARLNSSPVSAGGVDERAAFEVDFDKRTNCNNGVAYYVNIDGSYCFDDIQKQWEAWQARAALSAPSHGEQVRELPWAFLEAARQADDVLTAITRNNEPIATLERTYGKDWHEAVGKIRTALILQIAAVPSAGSQKEQGE